MKRILVVPSWYPDLNNRGSGIFFLEQAVLMSEDFDIKVLCGIHKRKIPRLKKLFNTTLFLLAGFVISRPKKDFFIEPPEVLGFEYEQGLNILERLNFKIMISSYLKAFSAHVSSWRPDIIHAHDTFPGGIVAYYLSKKYKIPYIITEHNYLNLNFRSFLKNEKIKVIEHAYKLLTVSEYLSRNLFMLGIKKPAVVTGNFVNDILFSPSKTNNNEDIFKVLFVGRDSPDKDLRTLVKTIREYKKLCTGTKYRFIMAGNLSGERAGERERKSNEVEEFYPLSDIEFTGFLDRPGLIDKIRTSDVYLCTSISETFGLGMCEAMMCGVPVVSTNNGGFDEMYVPGVNGIKTKIGDHKALAEALWEIKTGGIKFDPVKIIDSVKNKFGSEAFKSKISSVYNSINE